MPTNPESSTKTPETQESAESQETIDLTRAQTDALKEEITALWGTKDEIKDTFSNFFSKLWEAWKTFIKEWNFSKAIAILFWSTKQESQQTDSTTSTESTDNTTSTSTESSTTSTTTNTPTETKEKEPNDKKIVEIKKYIPNIQYDISYATTNNFVKTKVYETPEECLKLTYQAVKKLKKAEELAEKQWYKLKIRDAYRSTKAQEILWDNYDKVKPPLPKNKTQNVAVPTTRIHPITKKQWSWSNHWRGNAIDITLTDKDGNELPMPTKFDVFKWCKRSDVEKLPKWDQRKENALKLKKIMNDAGFKEYSNEWWHYDNK